METPKKLVKEMDKLYTTVENYQNARKCKTDDITKILSEILVEILGNNSTLIDIGGYAIDYLLEDKQTDLFDIYEGTINGRIDITEKERHKINQLFYERCKDNPEVISIKKAKQEWEIQQKKVINLLSALIQYVNIKYEG